MLSGPNCLPQWRECVPISVVVCTQLSVVETAGSVLNREVCLFRVSFIEKFHCMLILTVNPSIGRGGVLLYTNVVLLLCFIHTLFPVFFQNEFQNDLCETDEFKAAQESLDKVVQ